METNVAFSSKLDGQFGKKLEEKRRKMTFKKFHHKESYRLVSARGQVDVNLYASVTMKTAQLHSCQWQAGSTVCTRSAGQTEVVS